MNKFLTALACIVSFGAGGLLMTADYSKSWLNSEPTYSLVMGAKDGNEYVMDYNMTATDCSQRLADVIDSQVMDYKFLECEKEV